MSIAPAINHWSESGACRLRLFHCITNKHEFEKLVGLGSYLVNAVVGCNGCPQRPAPAPSTRPATTRTSAWVRSPPPKIVNPVTYFGAAGRDFGSDRPRLPPAPCRQHIVSRQLDAGCNRALLSEDSPNFSTPCDMAVTPDQLHPNCNGTTITSNCFKPAVRWVPCFRSCPGQNLQELTEHDLHAIYT